MARYDHLVLERLPERFQRRKRTGFGGAPRRDTKVQAECVLNQLDAAIEVQRQRRRPAAIHPDLILRVNMQGQMFEADWEQMGLTVLATDPDKTLILFSSAEELQLFRARIEAYRGGPQPGRKTAPHNSFMSSINAIGSVEPSDRIGPRLRDQGISLPSDFGDDVPYDLDVELWDIGNRVLRESRLKDVIRYIQLRGAEVLDTYIGPSITLARIRAVGSVVRALLTIEVVASIDYAPEADAEMGEFLSIELADLPVIEPTGDDLPAIGIIDSGLNAHPLLDPITLGVVGVPTGRGTADVWGHGTRIAGVAAYGDLRAQLATGILRAGARICAAKVLNDIGNFDSTKLVPKLMDEAIRSLHGTYRCRVFVIALGDRKRPYDGNKVGAWAATLDALAREPRPLHACDFALSQS